jgi:hypothetical protein
VVTDTRLTPDWLNDPRIVGLPDDAFRLLTNLGVQAVVSGTDGRIEPWMIGRAYPDAIRGRQLVNDLVTRGLLEVDGDGWLELWISRSQTPSADIAKLRKADALRKKEARAKAATRRLEHAQAKAVQVDVQPDVRTESPEDRTVTGQDALEGDTAGTSDSATDDSGDSDAEDSTGQVSAGVRDGTGVESRRRGDIEGDIGAASLLSLRGHAREPADRSSAVTAAGVR